MIRRRRSSRPGRLGVAVGGLLTTAAILMAGACGSGGAARPSPTTTVQRPHVVATTTMLGDVVRSVAGDRADVTVLMAPGDDPRTFTLPADAGADLDDADLIVTTGLGFEAGLQPDLDRARAAGTTVIDAAGMVAPIVGPDGEPDPHVWMDPDRLNTIASQVADRLAVIAGGNAAPWHAAVTAYARDMAAADESVQATLATIPGDRRAFLTSSDGLAYFAERYDVAPQRSPPRTDTGVLVIDVDSLGPARSATATNAGLLTATATVIAARLHSPP